MGGTAGREVYEPEPDTVRAAAAGDLFAFEELVRAYQVPVWRFLSHLLADAALAEDVAQETFLRVFRGLGGFSYRSKFSTWVMHVARNAGTDALRSRARQERLKAALPRPRPAAAADSGSDVMAAVESLSPKLRESLLAVEVLGLTYKETAGMLGVPEGTVKSRVSQARRQLVRILGEEEGVREM
jgi:RNA polymerase sigma-70 factor, ECF subfamily